MTELLWKIILWLRRTTLGGGIGRLVDGHKAVCMV